METCVDSAVRVIEVKAGPELKQRLLDESLVQAGLTLKDRPTSKTRVVFDWSEVIFVDLATIVWSLVLFDQLKSQGYELLLRLPSPEKHGSDPWRVWSFLWRWRFFEALKCIDHPANIVPENQISWLENGDSKYGVGHIEDPDGNIQQASTNRLLEITSFILKPDAFTTEEEARRVFDPYVELWKKKIIVQALMNWCRWSEEEALKFVIKIVAAVLENAGEHSGGTWVLSAFSVDKKNLLLGFADNGNGIPDALRAFIDQNDGLKGRLGDMSDAALIKYFTEPDMIVDSELIRVSTKGVLPTREGRLGRGLYYCKQMILENDGELRIRSGSACVEFTPNGKETPSDELIRSCGTTLRVIIPRKD